MTIEAAARIWVAMFLAGYPLNLILGRGGLGRMSYGSYLRALTAVNALLATAVVAAVSAVAGR